MPPPRILKTPAELLADIEATWAAATPGPWTYDGHDYVFDDETQMVAETRGAGAEASGQWPAGRIAANGRAIAMAPQHVAWLVSEVKRLQAEVAEAYCDCGRGAPRGSCAVCDNDE